MRLSAITDVGRQNFLEISQLDFEVWTWVISTGYALNKESKSLPSISSNSSQLCSEGRNSYSDIIYQTPKMPSTTEIAQQFDSIEDTIAAFSESLLSRSAD